MGAVERTSRYDYAPVSFEAAPIRTTDDGFNVWRGIFAFGDVVKPYKDPSYPEGVRYEFAPADEAFSDEALETGIGKPVTNLHPDDLLNPQTATQHSKGVILKLWREGDRGRVEFMSHSADLDAVIAAGRSELSMGFDTDVVMRPGVSPDGKPYHGVQTRFVYNHLSAVDRARSRKGVEAARITKDADDTMDPDTEMTGGTADEMPRKDMTLSEEAMAILETLPDADKQMVMEAIGAAAEVTPEATEVQAEEDKTAGDLETRIADLEKKLASMAPRTDAAAGPTDKPVEPAQTNKGKPTMDADEIIALANKAAEKTSRDTVTTSLREAETVRRAVGDGLWTGDVPSSKLAFVRRVLPEARDKAEAMVKAGRLDSLDVLFDVAVARADHNRKHADSIDEGLSARLTAEAEKTVAAMRLTPVGARV